jgi:sugar transferase EpsL
LKRAFDLVAILVTAPVWMPLMAVVYLLVLWRLGSPAFFRQKRPGLSGVPFELIKFRSMSNERNAQGELLPDEVRLTSFGKWLRSTSLDELPELVNVLKGEMSLVGPRPLLMQYLPLYNQRQARRHGVKPGITGWAQVNGRNAASWEDKLEMDVWYVENRGFWLDLKILLLTFAAVVSRRGINSPGSATAPFFTGSASPRH